MKSEERIIGLVGPFVYKRVMVMTGFEAPPPLVPAMKPFPLAFTTVFQLNDPDLAISVCTTN